ncbi:ABC transporter substrate-binding protein [Bradyrhizobium sp. DASA03076]|uniref:ABC transporter substrate-binding protein n=1 Tax=Bradyrhizobium sp. BLXBL-03 TaxID=3395916 RepID=UPI003F6F6B4E
MNLWRRTLLCSSAARSAASVFGSRAGAASAASVTVAIASLYDLSGPFDVYGAPSNMCTEFAVKELNAAGGLLSKQIVLKAYDCQSHINKGLQYAQQAALRNAVMAVGALTGAAREATRPVLRKYKVPYFYGSSYEGDACEQNIFCCNTEGNQQVVLLLEWSFKTLGNKLYYIASDYNAPRTFGAWNQVMAKREGGEALADDYYPLDVTDFTAAIAKIRAAKPDFIHSFLVSGSSTSFYRQWVAAGMLKKIPIISIILGGGQEHEILAPEEINGIYAVYNSFEELDTPRNKAWRAFLKRWVKVMHTSMARRSVDTIQSCCGAEAVNRANSFDRDAVMKAWGTGITWEGPGGKMVTDGATHHTTQECALSGSKTESGASLQPRNRSSRTVMGTGATSLPNLT